MEAKLGFVQLKASVVMELASQAITKIVASNAEKREDMITREMQNVSFIDNLFGTKSYTREQAIAHIKDDDFMGWEYAMYSPNYVGPNQEKLGKLLHVATALRTDSENPAMEVSIEVANWLY